MLSDFVVAVTLAETDIAQEVADILDAMSEEICGKAGDHERTTARSAGRDESGNL